MNSHLPVFFSAGRRTLEREFGRSSRDHVCKTSAGVIFTLERVSLRLSGHARAGTLALERVVLSGVSSGRGKSTLERTGFRARADALYSCVLALEQDFLRSSVPSFLFLMLERCVLRSSGNVVYQSVAGHFKITFYILSLSHTF